MAQAAAATSPVAIGARCDPRRTSSTETPPILRSSVWGPAILRAKQFQHARPKVILEGEDESGGEPELERPEELGPGLAREWGSGARGRGGVGSAREREAAQRRKRDTSSCAGRARLARVHALPGSLHSAIQVLPLLRPLSRD